MSGGSYLGRGFKTWFSHPEKSSQRVYLALSLNFLPSWQNEKLLSESDGNLYQVCQARAKNDLTRHYCDKFAARDRAEMEGRGREETCPALRSPDKSGKPRFSTRSCVRNLPDSSSEKIKPSSSTFLLLCIIFPMLHGNCACLFFFFSGKQSILLKIDSDVLSEGAGHAKQPGHNRDRTEVGWKLTHTLNNAEHSQLVRNYRNTKRLDMNKTPTLGAADL